MNNKKSSIGGVEANIIVLICYLGALLLAWFNDTRFLAWLLPLIIYIVERNNEFIKKHSAQACILYFIYSMISIVIMFMSISMFNITNIFTMNLVNFSGSLLMASTLSMIAMLVLVIITILTVIVASKVWHYEDYDIPFVRYFIKRFRNFMDKLIKENSKKEDKDNNDDNNVIISEEIKIEDKEVVLEDDAEIIMEAEVKADENKHDKKKVKDKKEVDDK